MGGLAIVGPATIVCLLALVVVAGLLSGRVLRDGGHFEAEVRALTLAFRIRASRREVRKLARSIPSRQDQTGRAAQSRST